MASKARFSAQWCKKMISIWLIFHNEFEVSRADVPVRIASTIVHIEIPGPIIQTVVTITET